MNPYGATRATKSWYSAVVGLCLVWVLSVTSAHAQELDGSVGYWAGERGEALDMAIKASGEAPTPPRGNFVRPDPEWGKEPVEELTSRRGRVLLRGSWNFTHAQQPNWTVMARQNQDTGRMDPRRTPPWSPGRAPVWMGRMVHIPKQWEGRRIALDFKQVARTILVFANDKPVGLVNLAGEVDITDAVTPGQDAKITIWFQNAPNTLPHSAFAGIPSDVYLVSYPGGARVTDVYVRPSTRNRSITLDVEVSFLDRAGPLRLTAEMVNAQGQVEKTFQATVPAQSAPRQVVEVTWPWADPTLWDIGKPNLYLLRLAVQGDGIDDNYPQEFGFREFWIDGRDFYLNGSKVFLRTVQANWLGMLANRYQLEGIDGTNAGADLRSHLSNIESMGFNFLHWTPSGAWPSSQREVAIVASQRGILVAGQLPSVRRFDNDPARQRFLDSATFVARQMRNFPAVVAWVSSGPPSMPGQDQNPFNLGRPRSVAGPNPELYHLQKQADPHRPIYWHAFTHGDIMSVNWYLCFIPLQEREDWVKPWTENGDVPVHGSEFGMPFNYNFMRKRTHDHNNPNAIQEEPFVIEYAAGWFGPDIYPQLRQVEWRFSGWSYNNTGRRDLPVAAPDTFKGAGMLIHNHWAERNLPIVQRSLEFWPEPTWRSWRTYGFSMMPNPWWSALTRGRAVKDGARASTREELMPQHLALLRANQPTLAWIAGPQDNFTSKDHSFFGGDSLDARTLVLINDTRDPQPYTFDWTVSVDGRDVGQGTVRGTLQISERKFEPISTKLPEVSKKVDGRITINGRIGEVEHRDTFAFRVFPAAGRVPPGQTVRVFDPTGKTTEMLRALGYQTTAWNGQPTDDLVVIGRNGLRNLDEIPGDLRQLVRAGGRLLLMAHHPDFAELRLGLRSSKFMSRQVFRVSDRHPIVAGLDDQDLRDWAGASTLVEAWPKEYRERADYGMPAYGWRTSNTGGLASGAPEVPHHAGWRPILVAEFALAYAPLMELDLGSGRVIWCSLDLEDFVQSDPAARQIAKQMIDYARTAPLAERLQTIAMGLSPQQDQFLKRIGLIFQTAERLPARPSLLILGANARVNDTQLEQFAREGGRVLVLPRRQGELLGVRYVASNEYTDNPNLLWPHLYPGNFGLEKSPWDNRRELEGRDVPVPDWSELAGLTMADFHRRGLIDHVKVEGDLETAMLGWVGRKPIGQGMVIFCQVDPESLDVRKQPYLRFTRWRQTRVVAQMIANAGGQFVLDEALLAVGKPAEVSGGRVKGYYHDDYRTDFHRGDNPFRYWRW